MLLFCLIACFINILFARLYLKVVGMVTHDLVQIFTWLLAETLPLVVAGALPKLTLWPACLLNQL